MHDAMIYTTKDHEELVGALDALTELRSSFGRELCHSDDVFKLHEHERFICRAYRGIVSEVNRRRSHRRSVAAGSMLTRELKDSKTMLSDQLYEWRTRTNWFVASDLSDYRGEEDETGGSADIAYSYRGVGLRARPLWLRTVYEAGLNNKPWVGNKFILSARNVVRSDDDGYLSAEVEVLQPRPNMPGKYMLSNQYLVNNRGHASIGETMARASSGAKTRTKNTVKNRLKEGL